jgi:small subunit ribosomal protein S5
MNENTKRAEPQRRTFVGRSQGDQQQYDHELLDLSRVVRVVKGGRRFRFRASVVVGDRRGKVGFGVAKSKDVQQAIQKAQDQAARNVISVPVKEGTIERTVRAKFGGAVVMLKPARVGTGMIAGATVRAVADLCGIKDLVTKVYGSANKVNNARATVEALRLLK